MSIRVFAAVTPFIVAWFVVTSLSSSFYRPDGVFGIVVWLLQSLVAGLSVSMTTERFTRKALPLASLFNMTLVFPDQAPSRFGIALRAGSLRRLESQADASTLQLTGTPSEAAAQAVELVSILSRHDRMTRGHTERVRAYADLIGQELDLTPTERGHLAWGALLHDIGKVTVPPAILNKQSRPTDEEWAVLQGHPAASVELLLPLRNWLGDWLLAAPQHHERWDGAGYPLGLEGTDISLAGRIVAVADAYDVITSRRSYKPALTPAAARKELIRCAGTQFDPDVVRAFLNVSLRRRWMTGPLASLAELPSVINIGVNLPAASAVAAGVVAVAGSAVVAPVQEEPVDLAFTATTVVVESEEVVLTAVDDDVVPTTIAPPEVDQTNPEPEEVTELPPETDPPDTTLPGPEPVSTTSVTQPPPAVGQPGPPTSGAPNPPTINSPTTNSPTTTTTTRVTTTTTQPTTTTTAATTTTTTAPTTTTTTVPTTTTTTIPPGSPTAMADSFTIEEETEERIYVLDNDLQGNSSLDEDTLEIIVAPSHAAAFHVHNDHIHYKSEEYTGQDTLVYRICNNNGLCDTATLTITITD